MKLEKHNFMKRRILLNLGLAAFLMLLISSCLKDEEERKTYTQAEEIAMRETYLDSLAAKGHDIDTTSNGIYYVEIEEGEGDFAKDGDTITVGYAGYLIDGTLFDTSDWHYEDGEWEFVLGEFNAIDGWDESLKMMNKGSKMEFIIPSELAYGSTGQGSIPPYQTLIFVIKLFDINPSEN